MPRDLSPHVAKLYELLADGQWHDREPVLTEVSKLITPGVALRAMEVARANGLARRKTPADRPHTRLKSREMLVHAGQRKVVLLTIHRNRRIERREVFGVEQLRLRPPADNPGHFSKKGDGMSEPSGDQGPQL